MPVPPLPHAPPAQPRIPLLLTFWSPSIDRPTYDDDSGFIVSKTSFREYLFIHSFIHCTEAAQKYNTNKHTNSKSIKATENTKNTT